MLKRGQLKVIYGGGVIDAGLDEALEELLGQWGYVRWADGIDLTTGERDLAFMIEKCRDLKKAKTYTGLSDRSVLVHLGVNESYPLPQRQDLYSHSPDGFNWGYTGSGPAQLALALLSDHLNDDHQAVRLHQMFKVAVVAGLPTGDPWELTSEQITSALEKK